MTPSKLRVAVASMNQSESRIGDLCAELGITLWMRRSIRPKRARDVGHGPDDCADRCEGIRSDVPGTRHPARGGRGTRFPPGVPVASRSWVVCKGGGRIQRRGGRTSGSPKHQALSTTRRRGRRGPVGRCDGRDRKRWNPIRSPRAVVFPESRGRSSSATFRPLAMTIVAGESGLW